jgi:cell division septation protein DedD
MYQKTSQPRKKNSAKRGRFFFDLSRTELFLWLGVAFLAMLWMFTLGVIVGRGHSPVRFDIQSIKNELIALKEATLKSQEQANKPAADFPSDETDLDFYDVLTDKKEDALAQSVAKAKKQASKPKPKPTAKSEIPRKTESKPLARDAENQKQAQDPKPSSAKKGTTAESYTVQVASLKDAQKAKEMVSYLKSKGYRAFSVTTNVPGKGSYHRVRVGHFPDRNKAMQAASRLRREELEPLVVRE